MGCGEGGTITKPLVNVLHLVDGHKPTMGYLYKAMDRAKEAICAIMRTGGVRGMRDNN